MVICLEQGADLHMSQLMPLPLTVFCFGKIQIGFAFLVLAHPGSRGRKAIKWVWICMYVLLWPHFVLCIGALLMRSVWPADSVMDQEDGTTGKQQQKAVDTLYFCTKLIVSWSNLACKECTILELLQVIQGCGLYLFILFDLSAIIFDRC